MEPTGLARRRVIMGAIAVLAAGCRGGGTPDAPGASGAAPMGSGAACPPATVGGAADVAGPIDQPSVPGPAAFAAAAQEQRQRAVADGDQSFGAIVVLRDRIVGLGPSRVVVSGDPTAHAEIEAVRDAARRLGTRDLSGCELYSTSPPCPMCESAAFWAGIALLRGGPDDGGGRAPRLGGR